MSGRILAAATLVLVALLAVVTRPAWREPTETVKIRGRPQHLHVYGERATGDPVLVSSGDGGWIHLAPHVAGVLAARGFFVVGFDTKAYLRSFTSGTSGCGPKSSRPTTACSQSMPRAEGRPGRF